MVPTDQPRRTYLVECYSPGIANQDAQSVADRAVAATAELEQEGCSVQYLGAIVVPADEAIFHLFASACLAAVREASVRAAVAFERISESILIGSPHSHKDES